MKLTHDRWKVAAAAWNNVPLDVLDGQKMATGSREGWQRVFDAVADMAAKETSIPLARAVAALGTADNAFRTQMDLHGWEYGGTELEYTITSALAFGSSGKTKANLESE